jgi:hypothetical protein
VTVGSIVLALATGPALARRSSQRAVSPEVLASLSASARSLAQALETQPSLLPPAPPSASRDVVVVLFEHAQVRNSSPLGPYPVRRGNLEFERERAALTGSLLPTPLERVAVRLPFFRRGLAVLYRADGSSPIRSEDVLVLRRKD